MNEDGVRVSRIDWLVAIPSLRLFEAIRLAVSPRVTLPVLLLMCLLWLATDLFRWKTTVLDSTNSVRSVLNVSGFKLPDSLDTMNRSLTLIATGTWSQFFVAVYLLATTMLIQGFCGIAAMRCAGSRFCTGTGCGLAATVRFSLQRWKSVLLSSLLSWTLLGLLCIVYWILRSIGDATHVGVTAIASLLYIVGCVVLGIGWLLSLAAIAIDRCDGAEALSRGISYVLSRWLRVGVYALVFFLLMTICDSVLSWVSDNAYILTTTMKKPDDPLIAIESNSNAWTVLRQFAEMVKLSIFVCKIAITYVLLRNVEDGVSLWEIDGGANFQEVSPAGGN
ncbi:MAG: hypothetical protein O2856_10035 [Planctomycetota bacterium]|nr:hypothetical protein [Planctomycetota bacterium]